MKIFVTGISGFIGLNLIKYLKKSNYEILGLSRKKISFPNVQTLQGDLNNLSSIKKKIIEFQPDTIVHLAWQDIQDYSQYNSELNLNLSIKLFNFLFKKTKCKKVIVTGSCWEYGKKNGICKEDDNLNISSYFARAKFSLYQYLKNNCKNLGIDLFWFRLFFVFGEGQKQTSLIPYCYNSIKNNKKPSLNKPENSNDFIHINDVAKILLFAIEKNVSPGIYNVGSGFSTSVKKIISIIEKEMTGTNKLSSEIINMRNDTKDSVENFWSDNTKLLKNFCFVFEKNLEQKITQYTSFLKSNF
jgi:nucleoside-diphosphate-sugar epimerase